MHRQRQLTQEEEDYCNKAQQRIAQLAGSLSEELDRNDVTNFDTQLSKELVYSIEVLHFTALEWTDEEIHIMMDYYTLRGNLNEFGICSIDFGSSDLCTGGACVSSDMLEALRQELLGIIGDVYKDLSDRIDQEITDRIDGDQYLLDLINQGGLGAVLAAPLTSQLNVGGIKSGDSWATGTPLEDLWNKLLTKLPSISGLSYVGNTTVFDVGEILTIDKFTWNVSSGPEGLSLSDSVGQMTNVPVTGTSYTPPTPINYSGLTPGTKVTWTLKATNASSTTTSTTFVEWSFSGRYADSTIGAVAREVPDQDLLNAYNHTADTERKLVITSNNVSFSLPTTSIEWVWIAVPRVQTGNDYDYWYVADLNNNSIDVADFILPAQASNAVFRGVTYAIFRYRYASPRTLPLKLMYKKDI